MKTVLWSAGLMMALVILSAVAIAQESSADASAAPATGLKEKPAFKAPIGVKNWVRIVGRGKMYAPGQVKKDTGIVSAREFARVSAHVKAAQKKVLEESAKSLRPVKRQVTVKKSTKGLMPRKIKN